MFAFAYLQMRTLPTKRPGLFFALSCSLNTIYVVEEMVLTRQTAMGTFLWVVFQILVYLVFPFAFWQERVSRKVLAVAVDVVLLMCCEFVLSVPWGLLTGLPANAAGTLENAPGVKISLQLVDVLIVLCAGRWAAPLFCRWATGEKRTDVPAQENIAWFLPVQAVLIAVPLFCVCSKEFSGTLLDLLLFATAAANLGADAALFAAMARLRRQAEASARAQALEESLAECLARYEQLSQSAAAVARVRHDERNHAQVMARLIEDGELERARAYLAQLPPVGGAGVGGAGGAAAAAVAGDAR